MRTLPHRFRTGIAVVCAVALAPACGGGPRRTPFTFTPVPYTIFTNPRGTPVILSVGSNGEYFAADELLVGVKLDGKQAFEHWARSLGFRVEPALHLPGAGLELLLGWTELLLKVPAGSAPAALALVQQRQEVVHANLNIFYPVH